ncbi:MAG: hypothetical protein U0183_14135 [Polyangiaceae bacterium]
MRPTLRVIDAAYRTVASPDAWLTSLAKLGLTETNDLGLLKATLDARGRLDEETDDAGARAGNSGDQARTLGKSCRRKAVRHRAPAHGPRRGRASRN